MFPFLRLRKLVYALILYASPSLRNCVVSFSLLLSLTSLMSKGSSIWWNVRSFQFPTLLERMRGGMERNKMKRNETTYQQSAVHGKTHTYVCVSPHSNTHTYAHIDMNKARMNQIILNATSECKTAETVELYRFSESTILNFFEMFFVSFFSLCCFVF